MATATVIANNIQTKTGVFSAYYAAGFWLFAALLSGLFVRGGDSPAIIVFILSWIIALGSILWSEACRGWQIPVGNHTFKAVVLFLILLSLSLIWSQTLYLSILFLYLILPLPLFFICVSALSEEHKLTDIFSYIILSVVGMVSAWIFIQYLFLYDIYGPRPHHPMLNPNNVASFINIGLLWVSGLFMAEENGRKQKMLLALVSLFYGALIITQSRTGITGFALSVSILFLVTIFPSPYVSFKLFSLKALKLGSLFLIMPVFLRLYFENCLDTRTNNFEEKMVALAGRISNTDSLDVRFNIWQSTWKMILDHPWLGTGLGSFSPRFPSYRLPGDISSGHFAHMDPLQFWAEVGIFAPVLFYTILFCVLLRTLSALSRVTEDKSLRIRITASFVAMMSVAMHAHMSFPLYLPAIITAMAMMMGIWYSATKMALPEGKNRFINIPTKQIFYYRLIVIFMVCLALVWPVRATIGKYYLSQTENQTNLKSALYNIDKAAFYMPNSNKDVYFTKATVFLDDIRNRKADLSIEELGELFNKADEQFKIILDMGLNRRKGTALFLRAELYHLVDQVLFSDGNDKALIFLREAIEYDPTYMEAYTVSAQLLNTKGRHKEALSILSELSKWPLRKGKSRVYYLRTLSKTYHYLGDKQNSEFFNEEANKLSRMNNI